MINILDIYKKWAMPNKNTFDILPIKKVLEYEIDNGIWIDPFAGVGTIKKINNLVITNDLNSNLKNDYSLSADDFIKSFSDNSIDGILFDPPYSLRQLKECYNSVGLSLTQKDIQSFWSNIKRLISSKIKIGGKVISFGWNSGGIGKKYGFETNKILLISHGGYHNDTIVTVEKKIYKFIKIYYKIYKILQFIGVFFCFYIDINKIFCYNNCINFLEVIK